MPCILVADDNSNIQKMVALALEDRGIKVVAVGNGEAAVRRLPDLNPDLVLADVFMPVRNGYEVCEFVKKDKRFAATPVILLVGAFDPLDEKETKRVGADGVLKKPFVPPDPLIAMVISILEKNPRAAAELAAMKPKEAKDALEPHHLGQLEQPPPSALPFKPEVPLKIEPKPLPEFPEPTAEEAALIYGFGRGRRTLEEDDVDVSALPATMVDAPAQEEREEFDGSSTTSDWRRHARDFEVPAEAANTPAFSPGQDLEPISFPSEHDAPTEQNRDFVSADATVEAASEEPVAFSETFANPEEISSDAQALQPEPEPALEMKSEPEAVFEPQSRAEAEDVEVNRSGRSPSPEPESKLESEQPDSQPESKPAPSFASRVTHWMDMIASPLSQSPASGWMDGLFDRKPVELPPVKEVAKPEIPVSGALSSQPEAAIFDSNAVMAAPQSSAPELEAVDSIASTEVSHSEQPVGSEPSWASQPSSAPEVAASSQEEPVSDSFADVSADFAPAIAENAVGNATDDGNNIVNDEPQVSPSCVEQEYPGENVQPAPEERASFDENEPLFVASSSTSDDTFWQAAMTEAPVASAEGAALSHQPARDEVDERIPTAPPLFREELADIPFLVRPPDFDPNASEFSASESETVDAIVQRVLERLEPQLHALLSQGVLKPLVEDLLHSELAKKEK